MLVVEQVKKVRKTHKTCANCGAERRIHWFFRHLDGRLDDECNDCVDPRRKRRTWVNQISEVDVPFLGRFDRLVRMAAKRKKDLNLSFTDFVKIVRPDRCHYCSGRIFRKKYGYGLDCKDPASGYTLDNVVPCCRDCNMTKSDLYTYEEFLQLAPVIRQIKAARKVS